MDINHALELTDRREKLLADAKDKWRIGTADISMLFIAAVFFSVFATHLDATNNWVNLLMGAGSLALWRINRLETRLDAIIKLLEREA